MNPTHTHVPLDMTVSLVERKKENTTLPDDIPSTVPHPTLPGVTITLRAIHRSNAPNPPIGIFYCPGNVHWTLGWEKYGWVCGFCGNYHPRKNLLEKPFCGSCKKNCHNNWYCGCTLDSVVFKKW